MADGDERFMNLPSAVRKQAEQAEAILKDIATPEGTPALTIHNPDLRRTPEPPAAGPQPAVQQPYQPSQQPDGGWEQRYRVLQGKYDAEIPALHHQIRELQKTVEGLNAYVATLQQPGAPPRDDREPPANAPGDRRPPDDISPLNPDDFSGYGEEMTSMVSLNNRLIEEIKRLRGQTAAVSRHVAASKDEQFLRDLAAQVPQWREINADQRWLQWLNQADPLSGIRRQDLLDQARNAYDVNRVATIFRSFIATGTVGTARPGRDSFYEPPDAGVSPDQPRQSHAEPYISRAAFKKASDDLALRRITQSEYDKIANQFQADIAAGRVQ